MSHTMKKPVYPIREQQNIDQPALPYSLIRVLIIYSLGSIVPLVTL